MATKKECDRCGKQWDMSVSRGEYDDGGSELCSISMSIPKKPGAHWKNDAAKALSLHKELCQDCARDIYAYAEERPPSANES